MGLSRLKGLGSRLFTKLIIIVGLTLLATISLWSYSNIKYQERTTMANLSAEADRLSTTIKLGAHYAMMTNSREDIAEIIRNVSRQPEIKAIRIYNKSGQVTYSDDPVEMGRTTRIKDEACYVCHRTEPPLAVLSLSERTRVFQDRDGDRMLGILSAIYNEPGCASAECHIHPPDKKVLGALDMVISLSGAEKEISSYRRRTALMSLLIIMLTATVVLIFILRFVNRPIAKMIAGTRRIAAGGPFQGIRLKQDDEMGLLAQSIDNMGREIERKRIELNKQRDEYQNLFETVPCLITVQDRNFNLLNYNRTFSEKFDPQAGDKCYHAYKGRHSKCEPCPVEKTFNEGGSHRSEETGYNRDGTINHWLVITSPVYGDSGKIDAAMEISLDITDRKLLEQELEKSEQKYHAIFNNIPNPVFVLDQESLEILDCNDSMTLVYGYRREDIINRNFIELLHREEDWAHFKNKIRTSSIIDRTEHRHKDESRIFVNIRISPSEYHGQKVLLVTTSDITKRLETEEQLAQAAKMAMLGEMATGVAHELNQPLSVIKTVSSFFIKKIERRQPLDAEVLNQMLVKVDANVDRASKIITHMRLFARKTEIKLAEIHITEILERVLDIFSQQLKVRGIEVVKEFGSDVPPIMADPGRLEQVFINLLINARDAIEEMRQGEEKEWGEQKLFIRTRSGGGLVTVEVEDTGPGVKSQCRDKIFDPFFTTKEVGKGTGLGLSISYGIVKDCGGDIRLVQKEGRGACFIVSFPEKSQDHDDPDNTAG